MAYAAHKYYRTLIDSASTGLTDHAAQLLLTSSNFDFSRAQSDGSDLRFFDATDGVELPYWIKSWDSEEESAEVWVRLRDAGHVMRMYYGHGSALAVSDGEEVFLLHNSYSQGSVGDKPFGYSRFASNLTINSTNTIDISDAQGLPDRPVKWVLAESVIAEATSARFAMRLPTHRSTFFAHGKWWQFYGVYPSDSASHTPPLKFATSPDGISWSSGIETGTNIAGIDAAWALEYHDSTNTVHLIASIGNESDIWFGIKYRVGTPQADGTITWSAGWQTAVANDAGQVLQDPKPCIASDGHAWIGFKGGSTSSQSTGDAYVIRNANTDGTWSTDFEVQLTTSDDCRMALPAPLLNGAVHVATYQFNGTTESTGYVVDSAGNVTSEGNITDDPVNTNKTSFSSGGMVGRISTMSDGAGGVDLVYINRDTIPLLQYKHRSAAGVWSDEKVIDQYYTTSVVPHPVICRHGNDLAVFWTDANIDDESLNRDTIHVVTRTGGTWDRTHRCFSDNVWANIEHLQVSYIAPDGKAALVSLTEDNELKFRIIDIQPGRDSSVSRAIRMRKNATSSASANLAVQCRIPTAVAGTAIELDFYLASISANNDSDNNDNLGLIALLDAANTVGPTILLFGNNGSGTPCLGYSSGGLQKISAATVSLNTWHRIIVAMQADRKFDLWYNGSRIAESAGYLGNPPGTPGDLVYARHSMISRHTGDLYVDNLRLRPFASTEPSLTLIDEHIQPRISPLKSQIIRGAA